MSNKYMKSQNWVAIAPDFYIRITEKLGFFKPLEAIFISAKPFNEEKYSCPRLKMMKAALMAAGESTRMKPLSANMPKHLLPVAGKPLIFHTLEHLKDAGIKDVLIIRGYHADKLREGIDLQDWNPMTVSYITQDERKGTAHAATFAKEFAGEHDILLMNGDVVTGPGTFEGLIKQHNESKCDLTLSVLAIQDPTAYGIVTIKDEKATELIEKPTSEQQTSNLVNAGIYAAGPALWDAIDKTKPSSRGEYEITDSIRMLIDKGTVGAFTIPSWWLDVGRPWDLLEANKCILDELKTRIEGTVEEGAVIKGMAIVEPSATVKSGAYIQGPVYIGDESVVGPNCYIRAHTTLCKKVKIGNAVEIKNSIIMNHTNVGHLSYVGDSIIGQRSNFGAGTITANLRHDDKPVKVTVKGKRIDTGRRKMGAIIGDDVKTGIGTLLSPGVIIYPGARTGIGAVIERDIGADKLVVTEHRRMVYDNE
jgi:bifunctional UDP-N-acetylglucosamine pyrophosphorylase/glucosamine-1-phosphate N-acetyltransferase